MLSSQIDTVIVRVGDEEHAIQHFGFENRISRALHCQPQRQRLGKFSTNDHSSGVRLSLRRKGMENNKKAKKQMHEHNLVFLCLKTGGKDASYKRKVKNDTNTIMLFFCSSVYCCCCCFSCPAVFGAVSLVVLL